MPKMKLMLITAEPALARRAEACGVGRVMIDLERNGKFERQKFRDTWISKHEITDIAPVAHVLESCEVMVRINPAHPDSGREVDAAIASGAQLIMLPMFTTIDEIATIGEMIGGRCGFVPLVETGAALGIIGDVAAHEAVTEVFIGLNDLHLSLGLTFMFEPLASGLLDTACKELAESGKPYGFGGIARIGEGDLAAELIMREHSRLGSTRVILSRTFARSSDGAGLDQDNAALPLEVERILDVYADAGRQSDEWKHANHLAVQDKVANIVKKIAAKQPGTA